MNEQQKLNTILNVTLSPEDQRAELSARCENRGAGGASKYTTQACVFEFLECARTIEAREYKVFI